MTDLAVRWSFAGQAAGFDDHVRRSVPLYDVGHQLAVDVAPFFARPGGRVYDLGCSTGTLTEALASALPDVEVIGVDIDPAMVAEARRRGVTAQGSDVREVDLEPAQLVIAAHTLQFTPVGDRLAVLRRIWQALDPGGALLLFEKVLAPSARLQHLADTVLAGEKLRRGLTASEVLWKAQSLAGVLTPLSSAENLDLLATAGFAEVAVVHRHLTFEAVLAVRGLA